MLTTIGILLGGTTGLLVSTATLAMSSIFFKETLKQDPNNPGKIAWFVEVEKNRSVVINRGGIPTHTLQGGSPAYITDDMWGIWKWYKEYVMKWTGYHVYFPYFYEPTSYDLPRYEVREEQGKKIFLVIDENSPKYRSNHVRTEPTTWYFEYSGAEIQKIPFTIKGSVQIRITPGKEEEALYKTDSWNTLLDQSLNSVIRAVVRRDLTLDMVIGGLISDLWTQPESLSDDEDPYNKTAKIIMERLEGYKIAGEKLSAFGIEILRADIIDFEDELNDEEKTQLRQAMFDKEAARGTELKGKAEAAAIKARGEATADAQKRLSEVHKDNPDFAEAIIRADALRAFANQKGGLLDALIAAWIEKGSKK